MFSLRLVCEQVGYSFSWTAGEQPLLAQWKNTGTSIGKPRLSYRCDEAKRYTRACLRRDKSLPDEKQPFPEEAIEKNPVSPPPLPRLMTREATPSGKKNLRPFLFLFQNETCRMTKSKRARGQIRPGLRKNRLHGSKKYGERITADLKVLTEESESMMHHRDASVVQDRYSYWAQSYPIKSKSASDTKNGFQLRLSTVHASLFQITKKLHRHFSGGQSYWRRYPARQAAVSPK